MLTQHLLHQQSGVKGALRMVLISGWRSKQREDAVPSRLHDVALISTYRIDHDPQRRIENRTGLFGIERLDQFGRALYVGEQRGDCLALAVCQVGRGLLG
jgi:hypothetical protein